MDAEQMLEVAIEALEKIANPIAHFQKNLKPGEQLAGMYAISLSNDPNYLKSIAEKALQQLNPTP